MTHYSLTLLDLVSKILPMAADPESNVFFLKMKGDYYRYMAEYTTNETLDDVSVKASQAYLAATEIAESNLSPHNTVRLGLGLNYSVFLYEVKDHFNN